MYHTLSVLNHLTVPFFDKMITQSPKPKTDLTIPHDFVATICAPSGVGEPTIATIIDAVPSLQGLDDAVTVTEPQVEEFFPRPPEPKTWVFEVKVGLSGSTV